MVKRAAALEGGRSKAAVEGDLKLYGTITTEDERYFVTIRTVHTIASQQARCLARRPRMPPRTTRQPRTPPRTQMGLSKMLSLLELQHANGVVLSYKHASRGGELGEGGLTDWLQAGRIVYERRMRERASNSVAMTIFPSGLAFGSLGDGSTDRSMHEQEASVLRFIGADGLPYNTMHDLLPLDLTEVS